MEPPGFRHHNSLEELAKNWSLAKWHGKAPHPFAISQPFPYAIASMRSYAYAPKYVSAKGVPKESPWSFQRCNGNEGSAARPDKHQKNSSDRQSS